MVVFSPLDSGAPVGGKVSSSLPSASEEDEKISLSLRRRFLDLVAGGTGFWVMNRLSPESLLDQQHIVT